MSAIDSTKLLFTAACYSLVYFSIIQSAHIIIAEIIIESLLTVLVSSLVSVFPQKHEEKKRKSNHCITIPNVHMCAGPVLSIRPSRTGCGHSCPMAFRGVSLHKWSA